MERYNGKKKKLKISSITLRKKIDYYLKKGSFTSLQKIGQGAIFFCPAQGMGGRRREEGRWEPGFFCFRPVQIFDIAAGGR